MQGRDNRYILRLWWDGNQGDQWRASLRDLDSDDTVNFATVEQLVGFLAALTEERVEEPLEN